MVRAVILASALVFGGSASAADLSVVLRSPSGQLVQDAVVTVSPAGLARGGGFKFPWAYSVAQQAIQFSPFVTVVPVGAEVSFPNRDNVRHHVYSFSSAKTFELKLYGHDESRSVRFDKVGVVALGCNIHDAMLAYVVVVDTPFAGKSGADGQVAIRKLPVGTATLTVWHPYMKTPKNQITQTISIPPSGRSETIVIDLRAGPKRS